MRYWHMVLVIQLFLAGCGGGGSALNVVGSWRNSQVGIDGQGNSVCPGQINGYGCGPNDTITFGANGEFASTGVNSHSGTYTFSGSLLTVTITQTNGQPANTGFTGSLEGSGNQFTMRSTTNPTTFYIFNRI